MVARSISRRFKLLVQVIGLMSCAAVIALVVMLPDLAFAATNEIRFPQDELASESVLPVFDQSVSVKNRAVVTARRIELGVLGGYSLQEAFYNRMSLGFTGTYHINEDHGINIFGSYFMGGLSDYGNQLNPIPGKTYNANLQFAPSPKYMLLANYQYTGYYGKFSLTKDYIMNLNLYGLAGIGMIGVGDASKPVVSLGLGQKFYITPSIALRFDLRLLVYQGPDQLSRDLRTATKELPASYFDEKINYSTLLSFGAIFMLPQL